MGWLRNKVKLGIHKPKHGDVENMLESQFKIPISEIDQIDLVDKEGDIRRYKIKFDQIKIADISIFTSYNEYKSEKCNNGSFRIYTVGSKGEYTITNIDSNGDMEIEICYSEETLRSDSRLKLKFLSEFFNFKRNGHFVFDETSVENEVSIHS